jgi:uncharacterized protein YndB with AHSA1/START domain
MRRIRIALAALALTFLALPAQARTAAEAVDYPDGKRILRSDAVVEASVDRVWEAFTTKAGIESWMVPLAEIDFRLDGALRTTYRKEEGLGGPETIVHRLIAYEPLRMLAFRLEKAPDSAPESIRNMAGKTWFVVRLAPLSEERTRVVITQIGFGEGPVWDEAIQKFEQGNEWTMKRLEKHFEKEGGQK